MGSNGNFGVWQRGTVATVTLDELKEAHEMAIQAVGMIISGGE